jgi:hypothetical protein
MEKTVAFPEGIGIGHQRRWKNQGGKWNNYADRVRKNVVFLGTERIVPHSERSQSRSYSKIFKDSQPYGWEVKVKDVVGFVLGKTYDKFRYLEHSKYNLPMVQVGDTIYSGFNMGAGENALFDIFSTIYSCGEGALLVMDEFPVLKRTLMALDVLPVRTISSVEELMQLIEKHGKIILDGVECSCVRPQNNDAQKAHYSGKKTAYLKNYHHFKQRSKSFISIFNSGRKHP